MTGVIVIGDHVQALGIIRSLGRRGIPVYLLHDKKLCIGRFSRYTKKFLVVPDDNDEIKFIDFLTRLAKNDLVKNWILMPTNDSWAHILSKNKEALEVYYRVPTPSWDILKFAYNKRLTFSIAEKKSVPFPKSIFPDSKEDIYDRIDELSFPVIIKGVIGLKFYRNMGSKALKAESKEELFEYYNTQDIDPKETIIQEVIPGNSTYSFCSLNSGKLIGFWMGLKIREHPMGFGTGTFARSVNIPELLEYGETFLKEIDYYGISEIEFIHDPRDGKYKLIEMNARTWLWHSLAIYCGVDLPYLLYLDMTGAEVTPITSFKEDVNWIHLYTDMWVSVKELIGGRLRLLDYLRSLRGEKVFAVFSLSDPLPFIIETLMLPYLWMTRL